MSKEEYHYVFKQIGDNIRKAREAKRLPQEELAFLIKKIADALDLKLADLFKECD